MMELNDKQLELLRRMGSVFFSYKKCAVALEVDEVEFFKEMKNKKSTAFKNYYSGFFTAELKHREGVIEIADRGSNPAQQMVKEFIDSAGNQF